MTIGENDSKSTVVQRKLRGPQFYSRAVDLNIDRLAGKNYAILLSVVNGLLDTAVK
jgi:hypothetical protein